MTIKEVYKENMVVYCKTEDESNRILRLADAEGWTWRDGDSYLSGNYRVDGNGICYSFIDGSCRDLSYFCTLGYTIIPSTSIEGDILDPIEHTVDTLRREVALVAMQGLLSADTDVKFHQIVKGGVYARSLVASSFVIADEFLRQEGL